jgi:hypothetical protein
VKEPDRGNARWKEQRADGILAKSSQKKEALEVSGDGKQLGAGGGVLVDAADGPGLADRLAGQARRKSGLGVLLRAPFSQSVRTYFA